MVQRYSFGRMIPTGTVIKALPVEPGLPPYLTPEGDGWRCPLDDGDVVFGLGETVRGMNKRGWHYVSNCSDEPHHDEDKVSLYGAHNFFLVSPAPGSDRPTFAVFVDFGGRVSYDIGYSRRDLLSFSAAEPNYDLYVFSGGSAADLCREFRALVGQSYIPPKWAFGYGQSRWGYKCEADVREVAENYRRSGIPLDMIYLDIDYMKDFADFTVDADRFPDLAGLAADLKDEGIRLVPIIDAGIKADPSNPVSREGLEKGYYCKKADGSPFVGAVWPGNAYFVDFLRPDARAWFGRQYQALLDAGIEGFWNDMNEPALFYTPERLAATVNKLAALRGVGNLDMWASFGMRDDVLALSNNPEDYKTFYHEVEGERVRHDRIHNLYGYHMTRAAGEAFAALRPGRRTLLFSRASCIGAHRYGGIWLGDNHSHWARLRLNVQQMPGVQMCGFLFSGADLGGFGGDTTPDLMLRWIEFGLFTPLMRNHTASGTRHQELYRFEREIPAFRKLVGLRYALLPYLYSEYIKAALDGGMYMRPLAFDYPDDPDARGVEDQLMVGEGLMVAPVVEQNAVGRHVYLPETMKLLRLRGAEDFDEEILPAGHHYLPCALEEVLLFLRPGAIVPVAAPASCVDRLNEDDLTLWDYLPDGCGRYRLYADDGATTDYDRPEHWYDITVDGSDAEG